MGELTQVNKNIESTTDIISWIKGVILNYCPIVDDRLKSMRLKHEYPEMDIVFQINDNYTNLFFVYGSIYSRSSTGEGMEADKVIPVEDIEKIIDFILTSHECISNFDILELRDAKELVMEFKINWSDKTLKGMKCEQFEIRIEFYNEKIASEYISHIINAYKEKIKDTPTFQRIQAERFQEEKEAFFGKLGREKMIKFITDNLKTESIREILLDLRQDQLSDGLFTSAKQSNEFNPSKKR